MEAGSILIARSLASRSVIRPDPTEGSPLLITGVSHPATEAGCPQLRNPLNRGSRPMLCISSSFSVSTRSSGDGSADQDELEAIGEAIEAYEAVRGPDGKVDGGKD